MGTRESPGRREARWRLLHSNKNHLPLERRTDYGREEESNTPAFDIPFAITGDAFRKDLSYADVYAHAKTLGQFEGAQDDI